MILRVATKADVPHILRIYAPFVQHTAVSFEYEVPTLAAYTQRFADITRHYPWIVCEAEGHVVGYAYASKARERAAYQWDADIAVYIDAPFHRRGIASAMYGCIEQLLTLQGFYNLYAGVTQINNISKAFHLAQGFAELGTFHATGYKLGAWHDVTWYEKRLRMEPFEPLPTQPFSALDAMVLEGILREYAKRIRNA